MKKKVLIALDYNPCAQKIAETGYNHGKAIEAEICLVHVVADVSYYSLAYSPVMGFAVSADSSFKKMEEQEEEAGRFLHAVVAHLGDSSIRTKVLSGASADAILSFANDRKVDLIVIGPQSHNSIEKLLVGEVAATLLKNSSIPILIVPIEKPAYVSVNGYGTHQLYL